MALRSGGSTNGRGNSLDARRSCPSLDFARAGGACRDVAIELRPEIQRDRRESPIGYLTRWRMLLAGDRLANSNDRISVISLSLGYESESAFSTAFMRVMGCSPRQYSRGRNLASVSP